MSALCLVADIRPPSARVRERCSFLAKKPQERAEVPPISSQELTMSGSISRRSMLGAFASSVTAAAWAQAPQAPVSANVSSADAAATLNVAQRMARYVVETEYGALDQTTIEAAKAHFIDAIGCGISAYHEVAVRACRDVALAVPARAHRNLMVGARVQGRRARRARRS